MALPRRQRGTRLTAKEEEAESRDVMGEKGRMESVRLGDYHGATYDGCR